MAAMRSVWRTASRGASSTAQRRHFHDSCTAQRRRFHASWTAQRRRFHASSTARATGDDGDDGERKLGIQTRACRHRSMHPRALAGMAPAIVPASTFMLDDVTHGERLSTRADFTSVQRDRDPDGFVYSRWANPTTDLAASILADLEGVGPQGGSMLFSSGMTAVTNSIMALVQPGDHVVLPTCVYGGVTEFMHELGLSTLGLDVTFVDGTNVAEYEAAIQPNTKVLYTETPANPTLACVDLAALGSLAKARQLPLLVDATVASPYLMRPLEHDGVTASIHSATKYLGGHSDIIAGAVSSNDPAFVERLSMLQRLCGATMGPFEAFLMIRGMKTLGVRMERHSATAQAVAEYLDAHPKVLFVNYPGLPNHASHEVAKKNMSGGFSGMLSFELLGGAEAGTRLLHSLKLINLAVSLGGVESLIEQPSTMTHTMVDAEMRRAHGVPDGLVRLSVGLEDAEDLIADLDAALRKV